MQLGAQKMEELMQDKMQDNNIDLNNNGIPDKFEYQESNDLVDFKPQGNAFDLAYENEDQIAKNIPDYKNYQWYKEPNEGYFYSLGQKVEDLVESNPEKSKEMLEQIADTNSEISEKDVEPLIKEAEQLTDSNPNNDEVDNQAVKEVTQEVYDNMSLDDIEKADAAAIKGEDDYLTVAKDLGLDEDEFLYYFEQAGYKPEEVENLTEEQKDEIRKTENKDDKFAKLKNFISSLGRRINTEFPIEETSIEEKENAPITSGVRTAGFSFLGNSGGSVASPSVKSANTEVDSNDSSTNAGNISGNIPDVAEMDGNVASTSGTNKVEHIDNTFDDLGFKDVEHEENIKSNEQVDLPDGETWTEDNDHFDLPNIKEMMTKQGGGIYLPFKFTIENGELYVSQIGTGRKLPFDEFLKAEPTAGKQLIELMNGDK